MRRNVGIGCWHCSGGGINVQSQTITRVRAMNSHWRGVLRLSKIDRSVVLEGPNTRGRYQLANGVLRIDWDAYAPETFLECSGWYIAEPLLQKAPDLAELFVVRTANKAVLATKIQVIADPAAQYEVTLRLGTTDPIVFAQIFLAKLYDTPMLPTQADTIVDLGANIGLASVFFGLRYPQAKILAVEPERANFEMLSGNVAALGDRVQKRQVAVWSKDGMASLHATDGRGHSLGAWGSQVSDTPDRKDERVPCYKLSTLLDIARLSSVDILKVDIEGADQEIFSHEPEKWLPRVGMILVEPHDRFRLGAEQAVRKAVAALFEELPRSGECLIFRRRRPDTT